MKHTIQVTGVPIGPKRDDENTQALGAYVAFPKRTTQMDCPNGLEQSYPRVIPCVEHGPETIVGQIRPEISNPRVHEDITLKKIFAGLHGKDALLQKNTKQLWSKEKTLHLLLTLKIVKQE